MASSNFQAQVFLSEASPRRSLAGDPGDEQTVAGEWPALAGMVALPGGVASLPGVVATLPGDGQESCVYCKL